VKNIWNALMGKKTYIVGISAIVYALAEYYLSPVPMPRVEMMKVIETAKIIAARISFEFLPGAAAMPDLSSGTDFGFLPEC